MGLLSHTLCSRRDDFLDLDTSGPPSRIQGMEGSIISSVGRGRVRIQLPCVPHRPSYLIVSDVLYVPQAAHSLLSVRQLASQGFATLFPPLLSGYRAGWIWQRSPFGLVTHLELNNDVYWLPYPISEAIAPSSAPHTPTAPSLLVAPALRLLLADAHIRLGHRCAADIRTAVQQGTLQGLQLTTKSMPPCEVCAAGNLASYSPARALSRRSDVPGAVLHYADFGPPRPFRPFRAVASVH